MTADVAPELSPEGQEVLTAVHQKLGLASPGEHKLQAGFNPAALIQSATAQVVIAYLANQGHALIGKNRDAVVKYVTDAATAAANAALNGVDALLDGIASTSAN